jgi:hypothetical protein
MGRTVTEDGENGTPDVAAPHAASSAPTTPFAAPASASAAVAPVLVIVAGSRRPAHAARAAWAAWCFVIVIVMFVSHVETPSFVVISLGVLLLRATFLVARSGSPVIACSVAEICCCVVSQFGSLVVVVLCNTNDIS